MAKRLIVVVLFSVTVAWLSLSTALAGDLDKATRKECRKTVDRLVKEGWSVFGRQCTVEEAMTAHYLALGESNHEAQWIEGSGKDRDVNRAVRKSQKDAAVMHASSKGREVKGRMEAKLAGSTSADGTTESTELSASFQSKTDQVVKSLTPSVILYRTLDDGMVEVRSLFIVKP